MCMYVLIMLCIDVLNYGFVLHILLAIRCVPDKNLEIQFGTGFKMFSQVGPTEFFPHLVFYFVFCVDVFDFTRDTPHHIIKQELGVVFSLNTAGEYKTYSHVGDILSQFMEISYFLGVTFYNLFSCTALYNSECDMCPVITYYNINNHITV